MAPIRTRLGATAAPPPAATGSAHSQVGPQPGGAQQNPTPFKGCGSGAGSQAAPCEFGDGDDAGSPIGAAEAQMIFEETARQIVKARGTAPAGMVENAQLKLTPTRTPWQRLLAAHIRSASAWVAGQVDQSYARCSRRRDSAVLRSASGGPGRRVIKPGWVSPRPKIEVIVDTSGSMSVADVATCRSEIETIARRLSIRGDQLLITEVDATVQSDGVRYTTARALGGIHGRGGTDMCVGIEHALRRRHRADVLIVMTDGETRWPADRTPVPLIALIVGNPDVQDPPAWVRAIHVDRQTM